jgi:hypothetical protein
MVKDERVVAVSGGICGTRSASLKSYDAKAFHG